MAGRYGLKIYYNEFDGKKAAMLRQLMKDGHIPDGDVDERSIKEVKADELKGYTQCHFFAGIGLWAYALELAGWPAGRPVWTGSCPCQPFSSAGRQEGKADERHLWPVWERLISECRPPTIYGEQVASAVAHGWLDDVYQGLEAQGYAIGSAVLPACSVGAPHKRERFFFVAHASDVADSLQPRLEGQPRNEQNGNQSGRVEPESARSAWSSGIWIDCPDGKQRPVEPGIRLLADGYPARVPILHAIGDAIVPQVAAEFIKATEGWIQ